MSGGGEPEGAGPVNAGPEDVGPAGSEPGAGAESDAWSQTGQRAVRPRIGGEARSGMGTRFGADAQTYDRVRPRYPAEVFDWIGSLAGAGRRAVDVGAGTGLFGTELTERGWEVTGVDPDADLLRVHPGPSIVGTAEQLPLPDASVDLVAVAQAWHWLDAGAAADEFRRVLAPGGAAAIVLNQLDVRIDWVLRLTRIMHAGDVFRPAWRPELHRFAPVASTNVPFETRVTVEDVVDLARTRSYWLRSDDRVRQRVEANIRSFLADEGRVLAESAGDWDAQAGAFRLPYLCLGYLSRPSSRR